MLNFRAGIANYYVH